MKSIKPLILTLLILFMFPILANAEPFDDITKALGEKDFKKAGELLKPLVEENNLAAKTYLGTMYVKGQGVERDTNKGLAMIMDAASQGFEQARVLAAGLCKELAVLGDVKAMYNMGYMCLKGWGGDFDSNKCIGWLEKAAEGGHERSAKVLSQIYTKGKFSITPDKKKAAYWSNLKQK